MHVVRTRIKMFCWFLTALLVCNLMGCAKPKDPQDPLEPLNRQIYAFNEVVDTVVYRPIAKTYNFIFPNILQARVTNFFNNIDLIPTVANHILQLNLYQTCMDTSRFVVNSTVGIGGLFDPAAKIDLPPHHSDVGLTLARWGYKKSAYFVIPFIGPSTIRDAISMPPDIYLNVWPYLNPTWIGYVGFGLNKVNQRAALLPTDKLVKDAFDPYVFVRDAYLQYRQAQIKKIGVMDAGTVSSKTENTDGDTFVSSTEETATSTKQMPHDDADTYVPPSSNTPISSSVTNIHSSKPALEVQINKNDKNEKKALKKNNHHHRKSKTARLHSKKNKSNIVHEKHKVQANHKVEHPRKKHKQNKKIITFALLA